MNPPTVPQRDTPHSSQRQPAIPDPSAFQLDVHSQPSATNHTTHPTPIPITNPPFASLPPQQAPLFLPDDLTTEDAVLTHTARELDLFPSPSHFVNSRSSTQHRSYPSAHRFHNFQDVSVLSHHVSRNTQQSQHHPQQAPQHLQNQFREQPQPPISTSISPPASLSNTQQQQFVQTRLTSENLRNLPRRVQLIPGQPHPVVHRPLSAPTLPSTNDLSQSPTTFLPQPATSPRPNSAPPNPNGLLRGSLPPSANHTQPATTVSLGLDTETQPSQPPPQQPAAASSTAVNGSRKRPPKSKAKAPQKVSTAEAVRLVAQMDRPPTRRSSKGGWTRDEDDMLRVVVMEHNEKNWKDIAKALNSSFPGSNRNDVQCLHRWQKVLQPGLKKGPWTKAEDETITRLVAELGANKWSLIAKQLPGRIGKQCRERWFNHLNPEINKEPWTEQEEQILREAHSRIGNKWAVIAKYLPGRTDNAIKNHYNATQRRAATRKGRKTKVKRVVSPTVSASDIGNPVTGASNSGGTASASASACASAPAAPGDSSATAKISDSSSTLSAPPGSKPIAPRPTPLNPKITTLTVNVNEPPPLPPGTEENIAPNGAVPGIAFSTAVPSHVLLDITNTPEHPPHLSISETPATLKKRASSPCIGQKVTAKRSKPSSTPMKTAANHKLGMAPVHIEEDVKMTAAPPSVSPLKDILNEDDMHEYMHGMDALMTPKGPADQPSTSTFSRLLPRGSPKNDDGTAKDLLSLSPDFRLSGDTPRQPLTTSHLPSADALETPPKSALRPPPLTSATGLASARRLSTAAIDVTGTPAGILPFATPPRNTFSRINGGVDSSQGGAVGSNMPHGSGGGQPHGGTLTTGTLTTGVESPGGVFLMRADATPGRVLGITPLGKSPGSLFLNSSPRDGSGDATGSISRTGRKLGTDSVLRLRGERGSSLFTPGGLFGSGTPGNRSGRLLPSPYNGPVGGSLATSFGLTPTGGTSELSGGMGIGGDSASRRGLSDGSGLLPPLLSPDRDGARNSGGNDEALNGDKNGRKDVSFTVPGKDIVRARRDAGHSGNEMTVDISNAIGGGDGVGAHTPLKGPSTTRQLFVSTPQGSKHTGRRRTTISDIGEGDSCGVGNGAGEQVDDTDVLELPSASNDRMTGVSQDVSGGGMSSENDRSSEGSRREKDGQCVEKVESEVVGGECGGDSGADDKKRTEEKTGGLYGEGRRPEDGQTTVIGEGFGEGAAGCVRR